MQTSSGLNGRNTSRHFGQLVCIILPFSRGPGQARCRTSVLAYANAHTCAARTTQYRAWLTHHHHPVPSRPPQRGTGQSNSHVPRAPHRADRTNTPSGKITEEQFKTHHHLRIAGLVGSIDNDMSMTDLTIGAVTALHRICESIDNINSTAVSHSRAFVVEVMGRHCGWLALMAVARCAGCRSTAMGSLD